MYYISSTISYLFSYNSHLAFLHFFGFPSQCDLMSSGLIFWFMYSSIIFVDNSRCLHLLHHQLEGQFRLEYCSCLFSTASISSISSVSKFWRQLDSSLTDSGDFYPYAKTPSLSNPIKSFKLSLYCFLA